MREDSKFPFLLTYYKPSNEQEEKSATFTAYAIFAFLIAISFYLTVTFG